MQLPGCGKTFRTITHMRSHVYAMHPDVFVARTIPDAKKRKRKGYVERKENAKRLRVDVDVDSDDEPLAKQLRYRALPSTKPDDGKIAYVGDVKSGGYPSAGRTGGARLDDSQEDEDMVVANEDEDNTDCAPASSTAITTPEQEQTPSKSIALQDCVNSNTGAAADERLVSVELRIMNLEAQLAAALSVIRQRSSARRMGSYALLSALHFELNLFVSYASRKNVLELEDAGVVEFAMIPDQDLVEMAEVLDDWSMWVTGEL